MGLFNNNDKKGSFYNADAIEEQERQEELKNESFPEPPVDEKREEVEKLLEELKKQEENNE